MISARHPNWSEWLAFDRLALLAVDWTALCPRLPLGISTKNNRVRERSQSVLFPVTGVYALTELIINQPNNVGG